MPIQQKIDRIQNGHSPRVIDLFAGCGGISLGFYSEGFELAAAIEIDPPAAITHANNFFIHEPKHLFSAHSKPRDIVTNEPESLSQEFGWTGPTESQIDVIVGGPPCQAYARVGRAKLREVAEHPEAFLVTVHGQS